MDVWFGTSAGAMTKVADKQQNLTSFLVNLPGANTYYWRIDSYLDGAILKVQTSNDLGLTDPWTSHEAAVPDSDNTVNGVIFDTSDDGDYINVIADIPAAESGLFARLSAVVTP